MASRSNIGNRKPGTPRLPIRKHAMVHDPAPKPVSAHRSAGAPPSGVGSSPAPAVAVENPRAAQPTQAPPPPSPQRNLSQEKLLTVKEAGYRLGKSPSAIRAWLHSGRLRGWQPGGLRCALMVSEASVDEVLILPVGFRM